MILRQFTLSTCTLSLLMLVLFPTAAFCDNTTQSSSGWGYVTFSLVTEVGDQSDDDIEDAAAAASASCAEAVPDKVASQNAAASAAIAECQKDPNCTGSAAFTSNNLNCVVTAADCHAMANGVSCNVNAKYDYTVTCTCVVPPLVVSQPIYVLPPVIDTLDPIYYDMLADPKAYDGIIGGMQNDQLGNPLR